MSWLNTVTSQAQRHSSWAVNLPGSGLLGQMATSILRFQSNNPFYGDPSLGSSNKRKGEALALPAEGPRIIGEFTGDNFSLGESVAKNQKRQRKRPCFGDLLIEKRKKLLDHIEYHRQMHHMTHFFLQCVYWGEGCRLTQPKTTHQGASCHCGCCNGSHFCILPNLQDTFIPDLIEQVGKGVVDEECVRKAKLLGIATGKESLLELLHARRRMLRALDQQKMDGVIQAVERGEAVDLTAYKIQCAKNPQELLAFLEEKRKSQYRMFSDNSLMFRLMNDVVQLYYAVNKYDCLLEGKLRSFALIQMSVAAGSAPLTRVPEPFNGENDLPDPTQVKDPEEGLECYMSWEHSFFTRSEASILAKKQKLAEHLKVEQEMHRLEKQYAAGSVSFSDYLAAIGKVWDSKMGLEESGRFGYSPALNLKVRLSSRMAIFTEIDRCLNIEKERRESEPEKMVFQWEEWLKSAPSDVRADAHLLVAKMQKNPKLGIKKILDEYPTFHLLEIFGHVKSVAKVAVHTLKTPWEVAPLDDDMRILDEANQIREWYKMNTEQYKRGDLFFEEKEGKKIPVKATDPKRKEKIAKIISDLKLALVQEHIEPED